MKLFFVFATLFTLLAGCNGPKESDYVSVGNISTPQEQLPLKYRLTDQELMDLRSEGLLTDSNINEIKKINK